MILAILARYIAATIETVIRTMLPRITPDILSVEKDLDLPAEAKNYLIFNQ